MSKYLAPETKQIDDINFYHDTEYNDKYSWLKAENWQEVLQNPAKLSPEIKKHLDAENKYQENYMKESLPLQADLFRELKGRIKEDDSSIPLNDGPYSYGICYNIGSGLPDFFRIKQSDSSHHAAPSDAADTAQQIASIASSHGSSAAPTTQPQSNKEIYLSGDKEKLEHHKNSNDFYQISAVQHAPDHNKFLFCYDDKGSEFYNIKVRSFNKDTQYSENIENSSGNAVWDANSQGFFYVKLDINHQPMGVYYHSLGQNSAQDKEVFAYKDKGYFISLSKNGDKKYIYINIHDHETTEIWLINAQDISQPPICVRPKEKGTEYYISSGEETFYILTNRDGAKDFKIMQANYQQLISDNWQEYIPHQTGTLINKIKLTVDYLTWEQSRNANREIVHINRTTQEKSVIKFTEEVYDLDLTCTETYKSNIIRFSYGSLTTPYENYAYNLATKEKTLLKKQIIPSGHDKSQYIARRINATSHDGQLIPISLYYHKDTKLDGSAPCLLYGYGAYGISIDAGFNSPTLSLVNRGFIYAIAHIRGGKEKGTKWYEDGKYKSKTNSFYDFISCAEHLVKENFTSHEKLIAYGGSAGGMLMGSIANIKPQNFLAIIAIVPFVDVLNTMLDENLPLTPAEWPEWGNPITSKQDFELIKSYSPYDNIKQQNYPYILAIAGLTDPRVTYWEAAKWVAKLREYKTDNKPLLFRINMECGHAGSADRFDKLKETSYIYAYILQVLNHSL